MSHRIGHVTDFLFIMNCIEFFSFLFPISFLISLLSLLRPTNQYASEPRRFINFSHSIAISFGCLLMK